MTYTPRDLQAKCPWVRCLQGEQQSLDQTLDRYTRTGILYCIFGFKGASTSQVIGARNEMMMDDYDGQMIFGDLVGLKLPSR